MVKMLITGMRKEQSENRSDLKEEEMDEVNNIRKFHPLINWKRNFMLRYVINEAIPINPLHHKGFNSIGCALYTSYQILREREGWEMVVGKRIRTKGVWITCKIISWTPLI